MRWDAPPNLSQQPGFRAVVVDCGCRQVPAKHCTAELAVPCLPLRSEHIASLAAHACSYSGGCTHPGEPAYTLFCTTVLPWGRRTARWACSNPFYLLLLQPSPGRCFIRRGSLQVHKCRSSCPVACLLQGEPINADLGMKMRELAKKKGECMLRADPAKPRLPRPVRPCHAACAGSGAHDACRRQQCMMVALQLRQQDLAPGSIGTVGGLSAHA